MKFKLTPTALSCAITATLLSQSVLANTLFDDAVEATAQDLEVIVVSGTKTEKALKDVAGSISVISQEDIEKQVINDMSQLFKYDPSVQISGKVGQAQNITVRGMGGDRVLMIKDGMRMNEGYGANGLNDIVGRGFIDTDTIKQVEIAKGAASSLYGSDALAGIVVFTTKDASDYLVGNETFAGKVKAGYSSVDHQYNVSTTLALETGRFEHLLNLSYRDGEEQQNYAESEEPFDIGTTSLLYKTKLNLNETAYFTFIADLYDQNIEGERANGLLSYFRSLAAYGYRVADENSRTDKSTSSFKIGYHTESNTRFYDVLNLNIYSNVSEQKDKEYAFLDINAPMFGVVEKRDMYKNSNYKQDTYGFLSNASLKFNDTHTLGYGVDVETTESSRHENKLYEVEGTPKPGYPQGTDKFPKTETLRAGLFVNDEITLMDGQLTITPGVRFDRYDMDPNGALKSDGSQFKKFKENHTSFNIAGLYKFSEQLSGFAQYGQGFKVPPYDLAYIEHYNQATSTYLYEIVPSDDLSPEESDSYEVGLRGHMGNFALSAAAFYTTYDNFLSTVLIESETVLDENGDFQYQHDTFQYQNLESVTIKGVEIGTTYFIDSQWSLFANASYQDGKDDGSNDYISSISPLSGIFGLNYEGETLSSELIVTWADRMDKVNNGNAEVAGYATLDWLINWDIGQDIKFNLSMTNLLDKKYIRYNNAADHSADDSLEHLAEPGRNFALSVNYAF